MLNTRRCVKPQGTRVAFEFYPPIFFRLPVGESMSIGIIAAECLIIGVYSLSVFFFARNFTL